jgi:hypothetical protein
MKTPPPIANAAATTCYRYAMTRLLVVGLLVVVMQALCQLHRAQQDDDGETTHASSGQSPFRQRFPCAWACGTNDLALRALRPHIRDRA